MFEFIDTVVIGTSLTELSDDVVRAGLGVARSCGARVGLVYAFQADRPVESGHVDVAHEWPGFPGAVSASL
jgi:hypothetical protein